MKFEIGIFVEGCFEIIKNTFFSGRSFKTQAKKRGGKSKNECILKWEISQLKIF